MTIEQEKKLVLKQAYYLVNGIWSTTKIVSKKQITLLEYSIDMYGEADYILLKLFNEYELKFNKTFKGNGASWSYEQL